MRCLGTVLIPLVFINDFFVLSETRRTSYLAYPRVSLNLTETTTTKNIKNNNRTKRRVTKKKKSEIKKKRLKNHLITSSPS